MFAATQKAFIIPRFQYGIISYLATIIFLAKFCPSYVPFVLKKTTVEVLS